jgi:Asp-tRNA(Asn)/Glu-tRNA(Gln) amidotransferase A subunit family amidase
VSFFESDAADRMAAAGFSAGPTDLEGIASDIRGLITTLREASDVYGRLPRGKSFDDHYRLPVARPDAPAQPGRVIVDMATTWRETFSVAASRERARQIQDVTNAFIEIFDDAEPSAVASPWPLSSPLAGLPFAYKDVLSQPGRLPTSGVGLGHRWSGPESTTLATLRKLGAVAVGATNLDPHSYMPVGLNRDFGRTLNPHDRRFTVGGSSSGSAAAVAAGAVPFAIGADTGGSVRIPAALCGVHGLKTSYGSIHDPGLAPLSPSHDGIGILARDLTLLSEVFRALCPMNGDSLADIDRSVFGFDPAIVDDSFSPEIVVNLRALLDRVLAKGFGLRQTAMPSFAHLNGLASAITSFEAIEIHRATLVSKPRFYPQAVRRRLLSAVCVSREQYALAKTLRPRLLEQVLKTVFMSCDIFVCPTIGVAAHDISAVGEDDLQLPGRIALEYLRLNRPFSYLGLPSLSIPFGKDRNGIPTGFQLVGKPHSEFLIMQVAERLLAQDR